MQRPGPSSVAGLFFSVQCRALGPLTEIQGLHSSESLPQAPFHHFGPAVVVLFRDGRYADICEVQANEVFFLAKARRVRSAQWRLTRTPRNQATSPRCGCQFLKSGFEKKRLRLIRR
jgi:hypothetical protein